MVMTSGAERLCALEQGPAESGVDHQCHGTALRPPNERRSTDRPRAIRAEELPPVGHRTRGDIQATGVGDRDHHPGAGPAYPRRIRPVSSRPPCSGSGPSYLGYFSSFVYIGVIWLNHHQAFARIEFVDRRLHTANLALLLTTAAPTFPTQVLAESLQGGLSSPDARTSVGLYALVAGTMCLTWLALFWHLRRTPEIMAADAEPQFARHGMTRAAASLILYLGPAPPGCSSTRRSPCWSS
jgi:hypothetical protein